ncbi:MAG: Hsp70 family protein [Desulfovibrio sp.]|jgi:molecular chaperone DnaK|nr:Hsp70 family protein [Desulfovibrio sp.]
MKNFVGIDLGTTNSAICSYDGSETRIWKSPEQNDVTPSAIYIDKRSKYLGKRAYDSAPHSPDSAATLFKRLMGTSTPILIKALDITMTPEECSAEILKILYGYLSEEIRNDPDTGTVITVPAAFNQMQKNATMQAADMAGIGNVALMQEPVAAVMSIMRTRHSDGMFLIYDLGGGTLDIAIAESISGRVNLLANGGKAMCGGRDFDRLLFGNVVHPWLLEHFELPEDFSINPTFKLLRSLGVWATERAKIELSASDSALISLSETELRGVKDLKNDEIYIDIPLQRDIYDKLIAEMVSESVEAARETITKAGLTPHDLERIVFVGGPTNYKPLRDKVSFELGISGSTDVNPMTAVAEGASLFAESIDWSSHSHARKSSRGSISSGDLALSFNYVARTSNRRAKIAVQLTGTGASGSEFQIDSIDTGWTSGRRPLKHGEILDVSLDKPGDNTFKVFVFDSKGSPITLPQDKITITRTAATIDAIPASHSVLVEVLDKIGGKPIAEYLVRSGDALPKKGKVAFKAAESLKAGAVGSLNFNLREGEIENPVDDNRFIGTLKISGSDFVDGVIPAGAVLECEYEMQDSGAIVLEVSVPCIGGTFNSAKNFYSRQEGQRDYASALISTSVIEEGELTRHRVDEISEKIDDPKLEQARQKLESAVALDPEKLEPEKTKEAEDKIYEARRLLAQVRKEHQKEIRQIDLDHVVAFFDKDIKQHARPSEVTAFENLVKTALRSINNNDPDFEHHLDELRGKNFDILWRQDWFVVKHFKQLSGSPHLFADKNRFEELVKTGTQLIRTDDIDKLRTVVAHLSMMQLGRSSSENEILSAVNILRG